MPLLVNVRGPLSKVLINMDLDSNHLRLGELLHQNIHWIPGTNDAPPPLEYQEIRLAVTSIGLVASADRIETHFRPNRLPGFPFN